MAEHREEHQQGGPEQAGRRGPGAGHGAPPGGEGVPGQGDGEAEAAEEPGCDEPI